MPTTTAPLLLDDADPAAAFAAVRAASHSGRAVAVHDHRWPGAAVERLRAALHTAPPGSIVVATSGSTGSPRAVVRDPRTWDASVAALAAVTGTGAGDAVWLPGPLSSSLTLAGAWHADAAGATPLLGARPDGGTAAAVAVHCVPTAVPTVLARRRGGDLPRLHTVVVAGDLVPPGLDAAVAAAGCRLVTYYGAAELSFVGLATGERVDGRQVHDAFPGATVRVRDGLLWASSPYLARGYLPGTGAQGAGPMRREGAWATVGDRGVALPGDRFAVLGRGAGTVTTGGVTVQAEDVEAALLANPRLAGVLVGVVVVGVPDARLGEVVEAVVEPVEPGAAGGSREPGGSEADRHGLVAALRAAAAAVPPAARPRRWHVVAALPRTPAGKPDRAAARDRATAARSHSSCSGGDLP